MMKELAVCSFWGSAVLLGMVAYGQAGGGQRQTAPDSIKVTIIGTLKTGLLAVGGETTGTTITANNVTWELRIEEPLRDRVEQLHGAKVLVEGTLERRAGVEIKERWIVTTTRLESAPAAGVQEDT